MRQQTASSRDSRLAPLLGSGAEAPEPQQGEPLQLMQSAASQTARWESCAVFERRAGVDHLLRGDLLLDERTSASADIAQSQRLGFFMGVLHVCPLHSLALTNPGLLTVRRLRLSRLRSALAIQL
eukprot:11833146-Alexandrium_andersonii.AAC.1